MDPSTIYGLVHEIRVVTTKKSHSGSGKSLDSTNLV